MPEPSILDARLAEIDRRLRMIQSGLEPVPDPVDEADEAEEADGTDGTDGPHAAAGTNVAPEPDGPSVAGERSGADPVPELVPAPTPLRVQPSDQDTISDRLWELAAAQERLLAVTRGLLARSTPPPVRVDAGPFDDTAALRSFERTLARLPEVQDVVVREYAGPARAVLEVQLRAPTA